jgi:hypothetical protein
MEMRCLSFFEGKIALITIFPGALPSKQISKSGLKNLFQL